MASNHWQRLLEQWRLQRRERGSPLEQEPAPPISRATEVSTQDWYPGLVDGLVQPLELVRLSLPVLQSYSLTAEDMADFITLSDYGAVRRVQSVDERLWQELADRLGPADLDTDYAQMVRNDQARAAILSARVAREGVQVADLSLQVFSPTYDASRLRDSVLGYLYSSTDRDALLQIEWLTQELRMLPDQIDRSWSSRATKLGGTAEGRILLTGDDRSWQAMLQDFVQGAQLVRATAFAALPMLSVLGPAGALAAQAVETGLEESLYRMAEPEMQEHRPTNLLSPQNRKWAAILLARFGRGRLYQLRSVLADLERVVGVLVALGIIQVRRIHFDWDALFTETVFESRLREWRISTLRFFVSRVLPVLEALVDLEALINALELEDLEDLLAKLVDELRTFTGRVISVIQETWQEQSVRKRYLTADVTAHYDRVSRLAKLRAALHHAIEVIDEFLALPDVAPTLEAEVRRYRR